MEKFGKRGNGGEWISNRHNDLYMKKKAGIADKECDDKRSAKSARNTI